VSVSAKCETCIKVHCSLSCGIEHSDNELLRQRFRREVWQAQHEICPATTCV
jgi:hypothetical protein